MAVPAVLVRGARPALASPCQGEGQGAGGSRAAGWRWPLAVLMDTQPSPRFHPHGRPSAGLALHAAFAAPFLLHVLSLKPWP